VSDAANTPPPSKPKLRGLVGVLRFLRPYPGAVALSVGLLLGIIALELLVPQVIGTAVTRYRDFAGHGAPVEPWRFVVLLLALVAGRGLLAVTLGPIRNRLVQRALADIRSAVFDAIQRLPFRYHDRMNTGELISRSTTDASRLQDFLFACLFLSVDIAVALVLTVALIFLVYPPLGWLALATLVPTVALISYYARQLQPQWRKVHDLHGAMTTVIQENIAGVRVVKAFAREEAEVAKFRTRRDDFLGTLTRAVNFWAARVPFAQFIHGLSIPLALWVGGRAVVRGDISVGDLTKVVLYLMAISHRMGAVGQFTNIVQNASAAAERILEIIEEPRTIVTGTKALPPAMPGGGRGGAVLFDRVSFQYADGKPSLTDVSFSARPGQTVAVVGPTGSGKSTLVSLIPRFYDVTGGHVVVDGIDVCELRLADLRRSVGIVFQETYLFSTTIAENIAYGRSGASRAEIEAAARVAQAHDFISELELGYDTLVGERGVTLSGGQKQRLALARAFVMNPRFLVLDDATASVDARTEHLIQEAMRRVAEGRTTFIIAHRLSSVQHADVILVLNQGTLVATGRHEELVAKDGFYRELCERQLH
jgi:ATP-binding cassette subfamily B protein